jgi:cobalt-zinc-cadmium resistance protein CzcA
LGGLTALVTGETSTLHRPSGSSGSALPCRTAHHGGKLNRVRETGASLREAILIGASERFRPVLMTATVATVGMMPAALATGVGSDVQRGVAIVVIGGLILATLLTLFVIPTFYYSLERIAEQWLARREATSGQSLASRGT